MTYVGTHRIYITTENDLIILRIIQSYYKVPINSCKNQ